MLLIGVSKQENNILSKGILNPRIGCISRPEHYRSIHGELERLCRATLLTWEHKLLIDIESWHEKVLLSCCVIWEEDKSQVLIGVDVLLKFLRNDCDELYKLQVH